MKCQSRANLVTLLLWQLMFPWSFTGFKGVEILAETCSCLQCMMRNVSKPTWAFEAVTNASGPAYIMNEGAVHVAPEVICAVLALLIDQPEATSDHLLHQRHPRPAQVVLIHHLHSHQLLKGKLHVLVYLQTGRGWVKASRSRKNFLFHRNVMTSTTSLHITHLGIKIRGQGFRPSETLHKKDDPVWVLVLYTWKPYNSDNDSQRPEQHRSHSQRGDSLFGGTRGLPFEAHQPTGWTSGVQRLHQKSLLVSLSKPS